MKDTAIVTYIDNNTNMLAEFGWLYRSWKFSGSDSMSDIVAFHHPAITKLPVDDGVTYVPLMPLTELDASWKEYPFINSTYFLTTPEAQALKGYSYILKTDNDCFLTPYFPLLRPRLATFGVGLYATEPSVVRRLADISEKWGIVPFFNNVGATFMMCGPLALQYGQLHMEYCRKLRQDEFKDGYGEWPKWYFGVLTMYAGQLAANALLGCNMVLGGLDVHSMANTDMCYTDYHIHAFHTFEHFSKFKWREGYYKGIDLAKLNRNNIADYCLWIAGDAP